MTDSSCVRCGYCCQLVVCKAGVKFDVDPKILPCAYLVKDGPIYSCLLASIAEEIGNEEMLERLEIGEGCCCPQNKRRSKSSGKAT